MAATVSAGMNSAKKAVVKFNEIQYGRVEDTIDTMEGVKK
jgi:hypothetical protein